MDYHFLKDLTIIDATSHLPGPYATHLLGKWGARIIKPITPNKPALFEKLSRPGPLSLFKSWHDNFQKHKTTTTAELESLLKDAQGIFINRASSLELPSHLHITEIKGSKQAGHPVHDLNVLASSGYLSHHIKLFSHAQGHLAPPALPIAGMFFAHHLATAHLAQHLSNKPAHHIYYLDEMFQKLAKDMLPLPASSSPFLHSGAFPCYHIYRLKDSSWVALAAMEKKYWEQFCDHFQLSFTHEQRFDQSGVVVEKLVDFFSMRTPGEVKDGESFCLTLCS